MDHGQIESFGLTAQWTMAAAAREYRESLAIERAIADDPAKRKAWLKHQLELEPITGDNSDDESPSVEPDPIDGSHDMQQAADVGAVTIPELPSLSAVAAEIGARPEMAALVTSEGRPQESAK